MSARCTCRAVPLSTCGSGCPPPSRGRRCGVACVVGRHVELVGGRDLCGGAYVRLGRSVFPAREAVMEDHRKPVAQAGMDGRRSARVQVHQGLRAIADQFGEHPALGGAQERPVESVRSVGGVAQPRELDVGVGAPGGGQAATRCRWSSSVTPGWAVRVPPRADRNSSARGTAREEPSSTVFDWLIEIFGDRALVSCDFSDGGCPSPHYGRGEAAAIRAEARFDCGVLVERQADDAAWPPRWSKRSGFAGSGAATVGRCRGGEGHPCRGESSVRPRPTRTTATTGCSSAIAPTPRRWRCTRARASRPTRTAPAATVPRWSTARAGTW